MTCLEQLQDDVSAILAIMELGNPCCDESDITGGNQYTDRVEDGVGDVPQNIIDAGYATGVSDWAGFDVYKCMIVHVLVDQIEVRLLGIAPFVDAAGLVLGGMALLAAVVTVILATGGAILAVGVVATTGLVASLYSFMLSGSLLETLAEDVSDNHERLACAMYDADGDEGALVALNDKIDEIFSIPEALVLKNLNLGPTLKALYAGRYDQQDVAETLEAEGYDVEDFDCSCIVQIGEFLESWDFEDGYQGWENNNAQWGAYGYIGNGVRMPYGSPRYLNQTTNTLIAKAGYSADPGDVVKINRVTFWYKRSAGLHPVVNFQMVHDGGTEDLDPPDTDTWLQHVETLSPALESTAFLDNVVYFSPQGGTGNYIYIDEVTIDYDIVFA